MSEEITLADFLKLNRAVIHCATKEQSVILKRAFHRAGKRWTSGASYLNLDIGNWDGYESNTCYSSSGEYGSLSVSKENGYRVFEFEDVFSTPLSLLEIVEKENGT